jgi:prepilin-type N-terminal cleavage/methylation domain-containing protein
LHSKGISILRIDTYSVLRILLPVLLPLPSNQSSKGSKPVKNNFDRILKIVNTQNLSAGFTLIELLVAMSLTVFVVGLGGFGLVAIMKNNSKAETRIQRRAELNRALDFIADEVRMASRVSDTATVPSWASSWTLVGSSPSAQLYVQIPLKVGSMTASNDQITVINHRFSAGNAVMFTGSGTVAGGLSKNVVYYITGGAMSPTADTFQVSTTLSDAASGTQINLNSDSFGSLIANQLLIYYISNNSSTWLPPKTINRSTGPCSTPYPSNCETLVDSIAANGFTASVTSSRQAELHLIGKPFSNITETYEVSTKAFARSGVTP